MNDCQNNGRVAQGKKSPPVDRLLDGVLFVLVAKLWLISLYAPAFQSPGNKIALAFFTTTTAGFFYWLSYETYGQMTRRQLVIHGVGIFLLLALALANFGAATGFFPHLRQAVHQYERRGTKAP